VPRTCVACRHPLRETIDSELVAGVPVRHIAAHTGTSPTGLQRHRAHLAPRLARAVERRAAVTERVVAEAEERTERADAELLDQLLQVSEETRAILRETRERGENGLALKALARLESQIELQARLLGELRDSGMSVHFEFPPEAAARVAAAWLARRSPPAIEAESKPAP
jgi:hypothetical protein